MTIDAQVAALETQVRELAAQLEAIETTSKKAAHATLDLSNRARLVVDLVDDQQTSMNRIFGGIDALLGVLSWGEATDATPETVAVSRVLRAVLRDQPANGEQSRLGSGSGKGAPELEECYCPEHPRVRLLYSQTKFQDEDEDNPGKLKWDKLFCSGKENGIDKNHGVFLRQALSPEDAALALSKG